ncbi:MAG: YbaK/EbsC family protein [bacterium]
MGTSNRIIKFISGSKYKLINHRTVYTAYDKATTLKVKPDMIVKTLAVKADKEIYIVAIPGNRNLDIIRLKKELNVLRKKNKEKIFQKIDFLKEGIIKQSFKEIKVGAIPPFGSLWKLNTVIDKPLLRQKKLLISAGNYEESLEISPTELKKIVPDIIALNVSMARPKAKKGKATKPKSKKKTSSKSK